MTNLNISNFIFTGNQNLMIGNISKQIRKKIERFNRKFEIEQNFAY